MTQTERAFVLGLDGVPWNRIDGWIDDGELPNFERLTREGAAGPFESTTPATTPVAWPSIATGVRADKHGIYGFQRLSRDYHQRMYTSADCRQPRLWDMLSPAVVANVPMTYPAREIDGEMVTGMMTPTLNDQFTYPPSLKDEILDEIESYRISLQWDEYADRKPAFLTELNQLVSDRRKLMRLLLHRNRDWRLFFFVYTAPDRLQHLYWEDEVLLEHYKDLDEILGEVLSVSEDVGATVFVVSDHGFGPTDKFVYVNRLLADAGYLSERESTKGLYGALSRLGVERQTVQQFLESVGIDEEQLIALLPRRFVDSVATKLPGDHALYDVDFAETTAFVHDSGAVYVNTRDRFDRGQVDPAEVPAIKKDLVDLFDDVTDPETGAKALSVRDGTELFPSDPEAPDLVVTGTPKYQTRNSLGPEVFGDPGGTAAGHLHEGIFFAWGPSIEAGSQPADATVYDLVPTLLHTVGEPIPSNTDGRVLTEIFDPSSRPATSPVDTAEYATDGARSDDSDADFDAVEDRLRGLGYMS